MTYTVYGSARSRAFRVLWLLEELGLAYQHVVTGPHSPELRAVSALGKVPVLMDGAEILTDSSALLIHLADKHQAFTAPAGSLARAKQDGMFFRILDELETPLWTMARHSFVLPEAERVTDIKAQCRRDFNRSLERLCPELKAPFAMGDAFTILDILLTHIGNWAHGAKMAPPPQAFVAYLERCRARPAFEKVSATAV